MGPILTERAVVCRGVVWFAGEVAPVAAVVVSYNAAEHLGPCLDSLAAEGVERVVVVDNGSADRSADVAVAAGAVWLPTGTNLGYGRAANLGAAHLGLRSPGEDAHLLVCNPDIVVGLGAVKAMVGCLEADPALGAIGPRLLDADGSLYPSARTFPDLIDALGHGLLGLLAPRNPFTRRYRLLDWDHAETSRVDWVSGACIMVRRRAWDAVGGFDPAFFMYLEDVDLCWRLREAGWVVGYEPAAEVTHLQGASASLHPYRMLLAHHRSMWLFAKRTSTGAARAALPVVAGGLAGRLCVAALKHRLFTGRDRQGRPSGSGRAL